MAKPDKNNLLSARDPEGRGVIHVRIGKESIRRALLYLDALLKTIEKLGGTIRIVKDQWTSKTIVNFLGEPKTIRLRERYKQVERPKEERTGYFNWHTMDYIPSGLFVLEENCYRVLCQDTPTRQVEDRIASMMIKWIKSIGRRRIIQRKEEEERRRKAEEERIRKEQELELKRRRDELERKQKQESGKVKSLFREAKSWRQSKILRDYIQTVEKRALDRFGTIDVGSEMYAWLIWARQQADRLDPLTRSPPSILDERIPE